MSIQTLFNPFQYKNLVLNNRFVMAPMTRAFSIDGIPGDDVKGYYERRAAAEVGLILTEGTVIDRPSSKNLKDIPNFYGDQALSAWKNIADAVHQKGGKIAPQIWHVGDTPMQWTPPAPFESPDSMSLADIEHTIQAYAHAAKAAKDLGFDAFEIHGAHGYLIDQFFWEGMNHRTDEFGGKTIKERSRFAVEVIKAMRQAVGPDFVIILRLSQWKQQDYTAKFAPTPTSLEDWILPLVDAGVDIFHGSQRRYWESEFEGSDLNFAGWLKKVSGQPTITVGSVGLDKDFGDVFTNSDSKSAPVALDELVRRYERGDFDLVAVGRAILQDPNWVKKVHAEKFDELSTFEAKSLGSLS
ncbi:12-oxophytodienoate reductase [Sphingobacterium faecium NBRC 15299]|uniref:NADH:flavin oxidoreductase n=1 Tax=Sphingobacterium faecium TaxID=34087 RepID=UPI000D348F24|nr:NADH:flavin oxidoreductase [Sphingobacterium faecium]PTX11914.1 2,4-dienoyl-CoA reductase-like NADH-dependent reductase (Old Yellow Enzyme family) [Sphingobacterium faecium]GEM63317.1 12-oxophytodienoate reductase [Sphingobacterium faecium NBRC 15299]